MAITLDGVILAVTLPQGMIWSDELTWTGVTVETTYSLTGALIMEQGIKAAGRPITLTGTLNFSWITRAELINLRSLLMLDEDLILTLHDARAFTVRPADAPLEVSLLPRIQDSGPANPSSDAWYVLESLKLIEV